MLCIPAMASCPRTQLLPRNARRLGLPLWDRQPLPSLQWVRKAAETLHAAMRSVTA